MTEHFTGQLDLYRAEKDNFCLGEGDCEAAGIDVQEFDLLPTRPMVQVCEGCNKPRGVLTPAHLIEAVNAVLRLDRLHNAGATYPYPDGLTVMEWLALDCLQAARIKDQENDQKDQSRKQTEQSDKARLDAMRKR